MSGTKKRNDGARHNRVYPSFWINNLHWSDDAKLLGLFLLTGPHRRTEGIYRLPVGYMAGDLGWTEKRARAALDELLADEFVAYDEKVSVLFICKALKHQGIDNPNQIKAAIKALKELPKTELTTAFAKAAQLFSQPFAERLQEQFPEWFPEPIGDPIPDPPAPAPAPTPPQTPPTGGGELLPGLSGAAKRAQCGSKRGRDQQALRAVASSAPTAAAVEAWPAVIERAAAVVGADTAGIWLEPLQPISLSDDGWLVSGPASIVSWVEDRLAPVLVDAAGGVPVELIATTKAAA